MSKIIMFFSLFLIFSIPFLFLSFILLFNNIFITLNFNIINFKMSSFSLSLMLDWISCLFTFTIMFISSMILLFSIYYIPKLDHKKFSIILITFIISMCFLIISDNIIFILLGWDGLGLSSYILVIFYQNFSSASSGMITLMSNRLGDIMILSSIAIMSMNFNWEFSMSNFFSKITMMLLFMAAISKSAQFPFSAWLPAAMAAPTPISALVHSSTLVTAGVFLLIRVMNFLHPFSSNLIIIISSMTSIFSSLAANWEMDMKKIVALSTLSQIALMMFAISIKSSLLAFFHLIIHAMFKSTMFLSVGIMIHSSSYQDMRMMGMNSLNSPTNMSILGISTFALMGIPFMSGFFSKDTIMEMLMKSKLNSILSILMLISLGMTISYSLRMMKMASLMKIKSNPDMNHYNYKYAIIPILFLSPMSIIMGSSMMWTMNPYQMFIIPIFMKLSIPMIILLSTLLSLSLKFNNKNFIFLGFSSIKIWFLHIISSILFKLFSKPMIMMNLNDKAWQEMYGPNNSFISLKFSSFYLNMIMNSIMMILLIMLILPIFLM